MKNIIFYKNCLRKGFALISATACIGSFAGCSDEEWKSNDYNEVNDKINYIKSTQESIIADIFKNYFTFDEAKNQLNKKGIYLNDSEIEWYLDMYKNANPKNNIDLKQKALEDGLLESHQKQVIK